MHAYCRGHWPSDAQASHQNEQYASYQACRTAVQNKWVGDQGTTGLDYAVFIQGSCQVWGEELRNSAAAEPRRRKESSGAVRGNRSVPRTIHVQHRTQCARICGLEMTYLRVGSCSKPCHFVSTKHDFVKTYTQLYAHANNLL